MYTFKEKKHNYLLNLVKENYSNIGKIDKLKRFKSNGFNSDIYFFDINNKKYLVKYLKNPDSIYGSTNSLFRIKIITKIVSNLSKQFPLEKFVLNKSGEYTVSCYKGIIRVTEFIKEVNYKGDIFSKSAKFLNVIHSQFWDKLNKYEKEKLSSFSIPYEMDYTIEKNKLIKSFLFEQLEKKRSFIRKENIKTILQHYDLLFMWANKLNILKTQDFFHLKSFTHNDFHPSNFIIDEKKKLNLLDFDNIQYSNTFRCLYFFLLRYSFNKYDLDENNLKKNYKKLKSNYNILIPNYDISLMYLLYIEIEKIFKILCRISEKKGLSFFAKKIISVHLPNVLYLIELNKRNF